MLGVLVTGLFVIIHQIMRSFLFIFKGLISVDAGSSKAGGTGTVGNVLIKLGICPTLLDIGMKRWRGHLGRGHFTARCSRSFEAPGKSLTKNLKTIPKKKKKSSEIIHGVSQSERIKSESQLVPTMGAD